MKDNPYLIAAAAMSRDASRAEAQTQEAQGADAPHDEGTSKQLLLEWLPTTSMGNEGTMCNDGIDEQTRARWATMGNEGTMGNDDTMCNEGTMGN